MSYLGATEYQTGSRGPDVARIQVTLNALGYNVGDADGVYGPKTKAGVAKYQSDNGLAPDGIVGPKTWALLMGGDISTPVTSLKPTLVATGLPTAQPTPPVGVTRRVTPAFTPASPMNWPLILGGLGGLAVLSIALSGKSR